MFWESACAVDREIVGKDSEGVVMGGLPIEFKKACS